MKVGESRGGGGNHSSMKVGESGGGEGRKWRREIGHTPGEVAVRSDICHFRTGSLFEM